MSELREGQRVSYVGDGGDGLAIGDRGKVVSSEGETCHVLWTTGSRAGQILFHRDYDLVVSAQGQRNLSDLDDFAAPLVSFSVRDTHDRYGNSGLLNALNEDGHLAAFARLAEDAIQAVASGVREDPSIQEVLSQLDDEDGDEFVMFATLTLLRDAFGEDD